MKDEDYKKIGKRAFTAVVEASAAADMNIRPFCREVLGISNPAVYRWNTGIAPTTRNLYALAMAGADINYILTGEHRG